VLALLGLGASALLDVGCSLWVSAELGDKPAESDGGLGGAGGGGGAPTASTAGPTSTTTTSTGSGAPVCAGNKADCDLVQANGCEVDLRSDREHCGKCSQACKPGDDCKDGKCK
jgi:outer membrane lipoprotein SlyB